MFQQISKICRFTQSLINSIHFGAPAVLNCSLTDVFFSPPFVWSLAPARTKHGAPCGSTSCTSGLALALVDIASIKGGYFQMKWYTLGTGFHNKYCSILFLSNVKTRTPESRCTRTDLSRQSKGVL